MTKTEDLGDYLPAYGPGFKFFSENLWYLQRYVARIVEFIHSRHDVSVLSLGIGHQVVTAGLTEMLEAGRVAQYTVVEGSLEIIERFKRDTPVPAGMCLVHEYFERFETEERFDVIEMGFVLEHVEDPREVVGRFAQFLAPGGRVFVAVPNARSLHRQIGHHAGLLEDMYRLSEHDLLLGHRRYFDLESITALVEDTGLEVVRRQGLMLKPITADQMRTLEFGPEVIEALMVLGDQLPEMANCVLVEAVSR